jgi:hypothetical protein
MAAAALATLNDLAHAVGERARAAGVFGPVTPTPRGGPGVLVTCAAKESASPAFYRVELDAGKLWVSLVMGDRWLSESIETDLVHTGDKLEELIDEELVELGFSGGPLPFEHFRSPEKLFTFRTPVPVDPTRLTPADLHTVATVLLAYEACFRNLGDIAAGPDDKA